MRTVAKLTKDQRRRRAYLYTGRALVHGLTQAHESAIEAENQAFADFCAELDCVALKVLTLETLRNIHRRCLPLAQTVR